MVAIELSPDRPSSGKVEHKEKDPASISLWAAGLLESGGSVFFERYELRRRNTTYKYSSPVISYTDEDAEKMTQIQSRLGGKLHEAKLKIKRVSAIELAERIAPYVPSRKSILPFFRRWGETDNAEVRREIADEYAKIQTPDPLHPAVYNKLVTLPPFLAGVVDSHGAIYQRNRPSLVFRVHTKNKALLLALELQYGENNPENIRVLHPAGTIRHIHGRRLETHREVITWNPNKKATDVILSLIAPYSVIKRIADKRFTQ